MAERFPFEELTRGGETVDGGGDGGFTVKLESNG